MQAESRAPVRTFAIGFEEAGYDEAPHARAVAARLGTRHTELYVSAREALEVVPRLPAIYDEPFADSSQIPTYLVAKLAREHVTVSLSGDGGDELFAGYNRYVWAPKLWRKLEPLPWAARAAGAAALSLVPERAWRGALAAASPMLPGLSLPLDKVRKALSVLDARSLEEVYLRLRSHAQNPASLLREGVEPALAPLEPARWAKLGDPVSDMQLLDALTYLPDDILVKVDRATMAVSLEGRVPFLDHRVAEFAFRLPERFRVRDGSGKWLLRQVLSRYLEPALFERPKAGFALPIAAWLRGELRDWAAALLDPARLEREGYFNVRAIDRLWRAHRRGAADHSALLWDVLMFQGWLEAQQGAVNG